MELTNPVEPRYRLFEKFYPIISNIEITTQKRRIGFTNQSGTGDFPDSALYFRDIQGQSKGLFSPLRNIYSYSFSVDPTLKAPGGSSNMNIMDSKEKYVLTNNLINTSAVLSNVYDMHVYNVGYTILDFDHGQCKMAYLT